MRFFFKLRTISCAFLVIYLLVGVTDGFAQCPKKVAHRSTAMVTVVEVVESSSPEMVNGIPLPLRNPTSGERSCRKSAPALTSTASPNMLGVTSQLATPPLLSKVVALAFLFTFKYVSGCTGPSSPLVNPRLAQIRTVVMLA